MFDGRAIGNALDSAYKIAKWTFIISVPLALWKIIDIIILIFNHISINIIP